MIKPLVSVIIPTLNEEEYIEASLRCAYSQDYPNFEVIVSDGNSEDATVEIASKYGARVIKDKVRNPARQRNIGTSIAKGSILRFQDADVMYAPRNLLSNIVERLSKDGVVAVTGPHSPLTPLFDRIEYIGWNLIRRVYANLTGHTQTCGCNITVRKDIYLLVGGFNDNLPNSEDTDFGKRLKKYGKIEFLDMPVMFAQRTNLKPLRQRQLDYLNIFYFQIFKRPLTSYRCFR